MLDLFVIIKFILDVAEPRRNATAPPNSRPFRVFRSLSAGELSIER